MLIRKGMRTLEIEIDDTLINSIVEIASGDLSLIHTLGLVIATKAIEEINDTIYLCILFEGRFYN